MKMKPAETRVLIRGEPELMVNVDWEEDEGAPELIKQTERDRDVRHLTGSERR